MPSNKNSLLLKKDMPIAVEYFVRSDFPGVHAIAGRLGMSPAELLEALGFPTCGLLRKGPICTEYGRPWHNVVAFVAKDHVNAEIVGLSVNRLYPSGMPEISAALAGERLSGFLTRRDEEGNIKRKVSIMTVHKKKLADAAACANPDKTPNWGEIMAQGTILHEQEAAGHVSVKNYKVTQTDVPGGKHVVHEYDVIG